MVRASSWRFAGEAVTQTDPSCKPAEISLYGAPRIIEPMTLGNARGRCVVLELPASVSPAAPSARAKNASRPHSRPGGQGELQGAHRHASGQCAGTVRTPYAMTRCHLVT
jgi:hypothetical protein